METRGYNEWSYFASPLSFQGELNVSSHWIASYFTQEKANT